jgi:hypothetical protein
MSEQLVQKFRLIGRPLSGDQAWYFFDKNDDSQYGENRAAHEWDNYQEALDQVMRVMPKMPHLMFMVQQKLINTTENWVATKDIK